jgi:sugar O-acyltransferase (sialic acid O-acetyltransferase NeuD family)
LATQIRHVSSAVPPVFDDEMGDVKKRIVVVGASGHARVVLDICRLQGLYEVVGLLDSYKPAGMTCSGYPVVGSCRDLAPLVASERIWGGIVAIGDNWVRNRIVTELSDAVPDFRFVTAIHPSAQIAQDSVIGQGTAVMAGAVVNPGARIGEFCIVNTRASIDHESSMGSYSSLGPGAVVGGCAHIGAHSVVGIGAIVLQEIRIGNHTVVGAGATVVRDVPDEVVAYGTPARVIRRRAPGDPYLR